MAKPAAQREYDQADRAFRKAWKLLERIELRLEEARAVERKRLRQLGEGTGPDAAHRVAQLEVARAEVVAIERLLSELSDLIARHARMTTGQTVQDVAHSVAAEIKDEAAEAPVLSTRRNRHHRPRRSAAEPDGQTAGSADVGGGPPNRDAEPAVEPDQTDAEAIELAGPATTRRNRHHRPRRRPAEEAEVTGTTDSGTVDAEAQAPAHAGSRAPEAETQRDSVPVDIADETIASGLGQAQVDPAPASSPAGEADLEPAPSVGQDAEDTAIGEPEAGPGDTAPGEATLDEATLEAAALDAAALATVLDEAAARPATPVAGHARAAAPTPVGERVPPAAPNPAPTEADGDPIIELPSPAAGGSPGDSEAHEDPESETAEHHAGGATEA